MDDVINAGRANYDLDLIAIPTDLQFGSTSFSNNQEVSCNDGDVYQQTNRTHRYRNKSNSSCAVGRPSQLIREDRELSKVYDSTKDRVLKTSNGIPLNQSLSPNTKAYFVRPFQASIEIADAFSEDLDRLQQNQRRLDKVNEDGCSQSWLSHSTYSSIDQPREDVYEEEEEDSVVDKDELSEEVIEEAESKDQVYNCDISDQKHVKPNLTDELPSSYSQDQKSDKIAHTRNISELKRELDCLQPRYVPYRRTSARNARPMSCDADVALSGAATNIRLSNSDGMRHSKPQYNSGPTSAVSTLRSDSTASEKSSKSLTFKLFPSSASFSTQKSKTKEPKKCVVAIPPLSSIATNGNWNKKSSFKFPKSMYRSKKNKSKSSDHKWATLAGTSLGSLEGISEVSGSELLSRKSSNFASAHAISCCSKCNTNVDISNASSFLRCTNCGVTVHEDEVCRGALDLAGCQKGVAGSKKKKMSLVAAFSGGTGGGSINAAGGSDSKRKLSARNSVTGASGTNTASAFSLGGMSTEGSYSALPHANSSSSLSNAGSYGQLQQLYSPTTSTSEFNMRQTGSIQEVEDEKDSGMVSFDTASIGSGHNNHYYHANNNNFSSPPSSVHMRSTSMITSLNNNRHPSSSSHSSAASSSTATTVHNSTSNRHSAGFNLGIGSQSRRSSSPSFACIYKPKSTPDLFSSVDKLANQSTEFGDESDAKQSRFRLELQRGSNSNSSSSLEEWQIWGWASSSSSAANGRGGGEVEWIKQVPQDVLNSLPNYTIQQQSAIQELIVTEVNFITNLDIVEDIYIYNIVNNIDWEQWHITKAMGTARNERVVEILFGPPEVRKNLRSLSRRLIIALCELRERCRQDGSYVMDASQVLENHFCEDQSIGIYINAYHHLTAGQNKAKKFYDEAMESVPVFAKFMRDCSNAPLLKRKNLLDTRTAITQRPHKYPALLGSLLRNASKELNDITRITSQSDEITAEVTSQSDDVTGVTPQYTESQKQGSNKGLGGVNEEEVLEKKSRLMRCERSIEQILGQLNSKLMEHEQKEKFENFMGRTDSKVVVLNVPRKDLKDRDDKKEMVEEKYDKNKLQNDKELLLMADFSVKLINSEMSKHKCVHFLVMNKCVVLLEVKDSGSSNSQYALLSVPKQRPVIKAESLKISFSETLSEEQAHLIDTDQPILNVITCKSRSEKNELAKACNFILPVKETPSKGGSMLNDGSVDQPKNHSFKKSHSSAAASSSNHYKKPTVTSNHRSYSQPKSQAYHANAILERNSAVAAATVNNYYSGSIPNPVLLTPGAPSNHLGLPKSAYSTQSLNGTGSSTGSNEVLNVNLNDSLHVSGNEQQYVELSNQYGTAGFNHENEARRIISARAELCHNQLAQLLHDLSHQSMNENESENLKKNISLLMGDLSHLKSSFLTSAFTGGLTRTAQHPVVSRSQSCKVPLEGSSAGHKVLARVGAGSAECSRGRFMATGGAARRHATFTSKDANRNGLDLDISSASSDVSHKVEINCTCGSGAKEKVAKLEAELDATKKELIKSKTEILQTQLNFFVKESKLKEDIDRMNQRWSQLNDTSDWRKDENSISEDFECDYEGDYVCDNHLLESTKFDPVNSTIQPISSSTMHGGMKNSRNISRFLPSDITASTPDAKSAEMTFNYRQKRHHTVSDENMGGSNCRFSFPGVEAVNYRSFRRGVEAPPPMSPAYNKSVDSSFSLDLTHTHKAPPNTQVLSSQSSSQLRRSNHVNNKSKPAELKQQLPTKLLMNTLTSGAEVKKSGKTSQSATLSSVATKMPADRAIKTSDGNAQSNLHSRRRGGNSPSLTLTHDGATATVVQGPYIHGYSSSDWEAASEYRAMFGSPVNNSGNMLDGSQMHRNHYSLTTFGMRNSIRDESGKEESSSPPGACSGRVDRSPTVKKSFSSEETSEQKQTMYNKGNTTVPVYML